MTNKAREARSQPQALSKRVELAGVRPITLKLVERGPESFFLYRSSRKLGTARVEPDGAWTARFEDADGLWEASAGSSDELLRLIGRFLLAKQARASATRSVGEANPELVIKGKKTPEQALSIKFAERARVTRIKELDATIAELRQRISPFKAKR